MPNDKCDLLLRYNEQEGKISMYAIPSVTTEALCRHAYVGFIRETTELLALEPAQAEQWVGRKVFSELDLHSKAKIGIRDYVALAAEEHKHAVAELEQRALGGDNEAGFELFQVLWNAALKQRSQEQLEKAEALLLSAAAQGHAQAVAVAAVWPRLKAEAEQGFSER